MRSMASFCWVPMTEPLRFLGIEAVCDRTSLLPTHIYRLAARGDFPKPVPLCERRNAWIEAELVEWCEARITARDQV